MYKKTIAMKTSGILEGLRKNHGGTQNKSENTLLKDNQIYHLQNYYIPWQLKLIISLTIDQGTA